MARLEGIIPGQIYSLDEFVLEPGTAPFDIAPDTANPDNSNFSLKISVEHDEDFIMPTPWIASNMETVCDNPENVMNYAAHGVLPVIHQFMPLEQRIEMARALSEMTIDKEQYPNAATRADGRPLFMMAVGFKDAVKQSIALYQAGAPGIRLDTPNGYTPAFSRTVREVAQFRNQYEDTIKEIRDRTQGPLQLWAGNVATPSGIVRLAGAGANTVLVGIGPGTGCGTAKFIGVHIAQATALDECAKAAQELGIGTISDGGSRDPRLAGYAISLANRGVMMGSAFAATHESPAMKRNIDDHEEAEYYGSASTTGRQRRAEKYPDVYQFDPNDPPEGFYGWIPVQGTVGDVVNRFNRTLMEQFYYVGVNNLDQFQQYAVLRHLSTGAQREVDKGYINGKG